MKKLKYAIIFFVLLFISLQFIPFSFKNSGVATNSFEKKLNVPPLILNQLKISCFDCHSNNTNYPIYSKFQPFNYYLNSHMKEGKDKLNFDEFSDYSIRKLNTKLGEITSQLEKNKMPLSSYAFIHQNAKLSSEKNQELINWFKLKQNQLKF